MTSEPQCFMHIKQLLVSICGCLATPVCVCLYMACVLSLSALDFQYFAVKKKTHTTWFIHVSELLICELHSWLVYLALSLSICTTSQMIMKWFTKLEVAQERCSIIFLRSSIKFQGHTGKKITYFYANWSFPDCNLGINSPMVAKWCTKLEVAYKRCPIVFHGDPSNFKVTWDQNSPIWTWIGRYRTVNPVWIDWWLWYDAQSLKWYRRGAYCFSRSSIKFQGHTWQKNYRFLPELSVSGL